MRAACWALLILLMAPARAAYGADQPVIAPEPVWVRPVPLPPGPANPNEAPVRILLADTQISLEKGHQQVFSRIAIKIQTPQGLGAGNISLPWHPDLNDLTVHKVLIRRGAQTIDVLGAGQTFTVLRRETSLETATLDGMLTANLQPEGLQVGDVIEYSMTLAIHDPTVRDHVEQLVTGWNAFPVDRVHLQVQWPSRIPVRTRLVGALPAIKPVSRDGATTIELTIDDLKPVIGPRLAPTRYQFGRQLELTDFASWADLGALFAPLYVKAAVLRPDGPLAKEVARIRDASADPRARAQAVLTLVQDRIRYVALVMGTGNLVPADAETTWARRYGDCKGKTALLLALLHALDIDAEPVVVNTQLGDGIGARLPMIGLFNHVLVRARIGGRDYWLDGARMGDTSLDRIAVPDYGWGLPLIASGAALVAMTPPLLEEPSQIRSLKIDASGGITAPAPAHAELLLNGDEGFATNVRLSSMAAEARDKALRDYWKGQFDFIEIGAVEASFDAGTGVERLTMQGTARMKWNGGRYETDGTAIGYSADFTRDPGPDRDAPFAVAYPVYTRDEEEIILPPAMRGFIIGKTTEVDRLVAGFHYIRHASIAGNVYRIVKTERSIAPEFPAKEAAEAQKALRDLADGGAYLVAPADYVPTTADARAIKAVEPKDARAYFARAWALIHTNELAEALADIDKALAKEPDNMDALQLRGSIHWIQKDAAGLRADVAKATALNPRAPATFIIRGMLASVENRPDDCIEIYTEALRSDPRNARYLTGRAYCSRDSRMSGLAEKDARAALAIDPNYDFAHQTLALLLSRRGDQTAAIGEFRAALKLSPNDRELHVQLGAALALAGDHEEFRKELEKARALAPDTSMFEQLGQGSMAFDPAQRLALINAALKQWPDAGELHLQKAELEWQAGNIDTAIATASEMLARTPDDAKMLELRARIYEVQGDTIHALADSARAIRLNPGAIYLYLLRANIANRAGRTDDVVKEAEALVAANPDNEYAQVVAARIYDRAGRDEEAIRAFDRALAIKPQAFIYLNRADTRPWNDIAGRKADLEAAFKLDPDDLEGIAALAGLLVRSGEAGRALAMLDKALTRTPDDAKMLELRAQAYEVQGDTIHALADSARAIRLNPGAINLYLLRANIATRAGRTDDAVKEAEALVAANPDNGNAQVVAARIYNSAGRDEEAIRAFDRALAIKPQAYIYLDRADARPWNDIAGRKADLEAALKLDPDNPRGIATLAGLLARSGEAGRALAMLDKALTRAPDEAEFGLTRIEALTRLGRVRDVADQVAALRARARDTGALNDLCWTLATYGVELDAALSACDAALAGAKTDDERNDFTDSRALALLRLGRLEEARAAYDRVLAQTTNATSLFGRAIVRAHMGDMAGSADDAAAARKLDPKIEAMFAPWGLTP